jgi:hypothetical protein
MELGLPEITIIILIIVVLFGITWAVKNKKLPGGGGTAQKKNDNTKV